VTNFRWFLVGVGLAVLGLVVLERWTAERNGFGAREWAG
jgi:hypothetical protein